ncbi:MAG: PspC domain-containing protein, partial [Nostocoides sp.]
MSQTTSTPSTGAPAPTSGPDALDRLFGWLRGLGIRRDSHNKWAAGVAAGVARRLGVDPVIVRVVFFVLVLFGGFGVTAYLLGWALLPNDRDGGILAERAIRNGEGWPIVLLVVIGLSLFGGGAWGHDASPTWWGIG